MLQNYLTIALRNLIRHRLYSLISLLGLAVGLAGAILIYVYARHELSYDRLIPHNERTYLVVRENSGQGDAASTFTPGTSGALAPAIARDFPEIERAGRYYPRTIKTRVGPTILDVEVNLVDAGFIELFKLSPVTGSLDPLLKRPSTAALTESTARLLFRDENPIGKTVTMFRTLFAGEFEIVAVVPDFPVTSTIHPQMIHGTPGNSWLWEQWLRMRAYGSVRTFVRLSPGSDVEALERKLSESVVRYMGEEMRDLVTYHLQPVAETHLHSSTDFGIQGAGNWHHLLILVAVGTFVLAIGCINFTNLTTARSTRRAREVGLRKVVGGHRIQLFCQFLAESLLLTFAALILGIILAYLALPRFSSLVGLPIIPEIDLLHLVPALLVFWLLTSLLAGSYPALVLSDFLPSQVLKSDSKVGAKGAWLRQGLVIFQFSLSILLMIALGVVSDQLAFLKTKNLGFRKQHIVLLPIFRASEQTTLDFGNRLSRRYRAVKNAFLAHPRVHKAAAYRFQMGAKSGGDGQYVGTTGPGPPLRDLRPRGDAATDVLILPLQEVDEDFLDVFEIDIVQGGITSNPVPEQSTDEIKNVDLLLSESAVRRLGWEEPIGKRLTAIFWRGEITVVGVVKDFHLGSLHEKMGPTGIYFRHGFYRYLALQVETHDLPATLASFEKIWKRFVPEAPFEYQFFDEQLALAYESEARLGEIFQVFAGLAILIACLGLFGLAAFTAERRTKEIGVRKVLGASSSGIVAMLSKEFLKLVVAANLFAWPVAYYIMNGWLENFAYRTPIGLDLFVGSGLLAAVISLLTVGYQAVKASTADPVVSLRIE